MVATETYFEAIDETYGAAVKANAVGLCLLIHGPEDAGQFQFLSYVEQRNPWEISRPVRLITPSHDRFDVTSLIAASLAAAAPDLVPPSATVELLAGALLERCRNESVVMFLTIDRLAGSIETFRNGFWIPLIEAAQNKTASVGRTEPFVVVLTMTSEIATPLPSGFAAAPPAKTFNPAALMVTPALGAIDEGEIVSWLRDHDMKRAEAQAIASRVIGDGRPRGVFDRLNNANLWARIAKVT